jgi:hypothetical protein
VLAGFNEPLKSVMERIYSEQYARCARAPRPPARPSVESAVCVRRRDRPERAIERSTPRVGPS